VADVPRTRAPDAVTAGGARPSATLPRFSGFGDAASAELREAVGRTRTIFGVGLTLWALAVLADVALGLGGAAPLGVLLTLRASVLALGGAVLLRLRRPPLPSERVFGLLSVALYTAIAFALGVYALVWGGIASPAGHGVAAVLCVQAVGRPLPLRRGLPSMLVVASGFPMALALGALFSPDVLAQFSDDEALAGLGTQTLLSLMTAGILAVGGDTTWSLKERLFATRVVGRYRLDQKLGEGGMGEVWRAYHPALKKHVAVKILRADLANGQSLSRFDREVGAMTGLGHPHTVRVFDAGQTDDGLCYYAMELLSGKTLADVVQAEGPLSPERAVRLVEQAARAIAEAHDKGLVHRDLKPENLFVCELGGEKDFVKVLDFGIAKLLDGSADATLTREGVIVGTPAYMSPEQCLGRPVDVRSDVYALGGVLHFALTGVPPFGHEPVARVLAAHVTEELSDPTSLIPWQVPEALVAVLRRALAKAPGDRFGSMLELQRALVDLGPLEGLPRRGTSAAPVSPTSATVQG
jgi:serine/threonine-protein kinase